MSHIKYPQPNTKKIELGAKYYYSGAVSVFGSIWQGSHIDFQILELNKAYLTEREAQLRFDWELEETGKKTIPQWFKDYGPEVEVQRGSIEPWEDFDHAIEIMDWRNFRPSNFRAKLSPTSDVVVVVSGVEYRWAPTLKEGHGLSKVYDVSAPFGEIVERTGNHYGPCIHGTVEGARQHANSFKALEEL